METKTELVSQKLEAHDLTGAIKVAITEADEIKAIAQEMRTSLDEGLAQLNQLAEAALEKYELL